MHHWLELNKTYGALNIAYYSLYTGGGVKKSFLKCVHCSMLHFPNTMRNINMSKSRSLKQGSKSQKSKCSNVNRIVPHYFFCSMQHRVQQKYCDVYVPFTRSGFCWGEGQWLAIQLYFWHYTLIDNQLFNWSFQTILARTVHGFVRPLSGMLCVATKLRDY